MELNYDDCLRPIFTKQIFEQLINDRSLNPFGEKGTGRSRLVKDLKSLARQAEISTLEFNMKSFQFDYSGFVKEAEMKLIHTQSQPKLLMQGKSNAPIEDLPALSLLMTHHQFTIPKQLIIFLDDFDALLNDTGHVFPKQFFNDLNSLKNTTNVTLCCITSKSHKTSSIYYDGGKNHSSSWLELLPIDIPSLTRTAIKKTLDQKLVNSENWQKERNKERVISIIHEHPKQWDLIEIIANDYIYYANSSYKKRMKKCLKSYKKRHPKSWLRYLTWKNIKKEFTEILTPLIKGENILKDD